MVHKVAAALLTLTATTAAAGDPVSGWRLTARRQICLIPSAFMQSREDLLEEVDAKRAAILNTEKAASLKALATRGKLKLETRVRLPELYFLAAAAGDAKTKIEAGMAILKVCSKPNFEAYESNGENKCSAFTEIVGQPQAVQSEIEQQIAFLNKVYKPTGRETRRSLNGMSLNVYDGRGHGPGLKVRYVGYGLRELLRTGKLCLSPVGCYYVDRAMLVSSAVPSQLAVSEPERTGAGLEDCVARKDPNEREEKLDQLVESEAAK